MPSPFPGMNPYFEQPVHWQDFHLKFLAAINEQLSPQVRPHYFVVLERHIYVQERPADEVRLLRADLLVARSSSASATEQRSAAAFLEAPSQVEHPALEVERIPYLEIRHAARGDLVTVLELLSPANKQGDNRQQYLTKREQILSSETHLVEIDLLRGGEAMPDTNRSACEYSVLVSRVERRPLAGFWPLRLHERLPSIPVPLRPTDADARVDLRAALNRVYDAYCYEDFIYREAPSPPLSAEDAEWARQYVPGRG